METRTPKNRLLLLSALLALLMFSTLACSIGTLTIGKTSTTVDITLKEDEINQLFQHITIEDRPGHDRLLEKVTSIEMHDGYIRVLGTDRAGLKGSYDVSLSAENDQLKVKIVAVNILGMEISDTKIAGINQDIADNLNRSVTQSYGVVLYKGATVSEGVFKMKIQVNYYKKFT